MPAIPAVASAAKLPTDKGLVAVNMALLSIGALLMYAGYKGASLTDVFNNQPASQGPDSNPANTKNPSTVDPSKLSKGMSTLQATPPTIGGTARKTKQAEGGTTMFDGKPVANWMIPPLKAARATGLWKGKVISGYRTAAEQTVAANNYGLQHYGSDPQTSNHRGKTYPRGAIDVTDPQGLNAALRKVNVLPKPVWGGPVIGDVPHFSATGH